MKLFEEFKEYENLWEISENLQEARKSNPAAPATIKIVNIEPKIQEPVGTANRHYRHYDEVTYIDPIFNIEMKAIIFEETPGFGNYFGWGAKHSGHWDYAAYTYDGELLPNIDPNGSLPVSLKKEMSKVVNDINNPTTIED